MSTPKRCNCPQCQPVGADCPACRELDAALAENKAYERALLDCKGRIMDLQGQLAAALEHIGTEEYND